MFSIQAATTANMLLLKSCGILNTAATESKSGRIIPDELRLDVANEQLLQFKKCFDLSHRRIS